VAARLRGCAGAAAGTWPSLPRGLPGAAALGLPLLLLSTRALLELALVPGCRLSALSRTLLPAALMMTEAPAAGRPSDADGGLRSAPAAGEASSWLALPRGLAGTSGAGLLGW
jgi:hypothetical protein